MQQQQQPLSMLFASYAGQPVPTPPRDADGSVVTPNGETVFALDDAVAHFGIAEQTLRQLYADTIGPLLLAPDAVQLDVELPSSFGQKLLAFPDAPVIRPEDLRVLRENFCVGLKDREFELFVKMCNRTALDPFTKQIYWAFRPDRTTGQLVFSVEIGIAGLRLLAVRTGELVGTKGPFFSGDGKTWVRAWCGEGQPTFAKFSLKRRGREGYQTAVADWDAYVKLVEGEQVKGSAIDYMWMKFGYLCLGRCAEALCHRMVFPEIGTLYTPDEMAQSTNPPPLPPPNGPDGGPEAPSSTHHEESQLPDADHGESQVTEHVPPSLPLRPARRRHAAHRGNARLLQRWT